MRLVHWLVASAGLLASAVVARADTITQVDYPGSQYTTVFTYDALSNRVAGTYADSTGTHSYTYDTVGNTYTTLTDPVAGAATTTVYQYDSLGRQTGSTTDSQGHSHGYFYDTTSNVVRTLDYPSANNYTTAYTYDALSGTVAGAYRDSQGHLHGYTYDTSSQNYTTRDVAGAQDTTIYRYDAQGNMVGTYTDSQGNTHGFRYDATNNLVLTLDVPGAPLTTAYQYDALYQRIVGSSTDSQGRTTAYIYDMTHRSQPLNKSYGYLWWLNGQESFMVPGLQLVLPGKLFPNAPDDLFAALGKNDQKIHIVPSKGWVVVRQGEDAGYVGPGGGQVPIAFDNDLWKYLNQLVCNPVGTSEAVPGPLRIWPNPATEGWRIRSDGPVEQVEVYDVRGVLLHTISGNGSPEVWVDGTGWPAGVFNLKVSSGGQVFWGKAVRQ